MSANDRWRCLQVGCNPRLKEHNAQQHKADTGHRVAKWPTRSAEGERRARARNRTGYYDKYNVGPKSVEARGHLFGRGYGAEVFADFEGEAEREDGRDE